MSPEVLPVIAFGAVVFLDDWPLLQSMLSRPIVVGPIVGATLGEPAAGVVWGGVFEAVYLGTLPVGLAHVPQAGLAALIGTWMAITTASEGLVAGGLVMTLAVAAGAIGARLDRWHRRLNGRTAARVQAAVETGHPVVLGRSILLAIVRAGAVGAVATAAMLLCGGAVAEVLAATAWMGWLPDDWVVVAAGAALAVNATRMFVVGRRYSLAWVGGIGVALLTAGFVGL